MDGGSYFKWNMQERIQIRNLFEDGLTQVGLNLRNSYNGGIAYELLVGYVSLLAKFLFF